jgi:hypothetical protein
MLPYPAAIAGQVGGSLELATLFIGLEAVISNVTKHLNFKRDEICALCGERNACCGEIGIWTGELAC